jgi:hypothetical protein
MIPPKIFDEELAKLASPRQREMYEIYCREGSLRATARAMGLAFSSVKCTIDLMMDKAVASGWVPPQPEQVVKGISTLRDAGGDLTAEWTKTRMRGASRGDSVELPDPKKLVSVSTMTDAEGRVVVQWAKELPELQAREALWEAFAQELSRKIEPDAKIDYLNLDTVRSDLLTVYPVGDHHTGMLAWHLETGGADYDLNIAERRLHEATSRLIDKASPSEVALVALLGDFFHYDSYATVTPAHKNLLDADGRFPKMVEVGIRMIRRLVAKALEKHHTVHLIVASGNHDPATMAAIRIFMKVFYEGEPRVVVDTSPQAYHYFEFGANLIGVHHGDKAKPDKLLGIMAHDQWEAWGRTKYRVWMTGHVHHESRKEYPGGWVETFGVLAPADAYAAMGGWRSICQMKAIEYHRQYGEIGRHTVIPEMFE